MDYLETILRRQWTLWGALPQGGAPAVPEEKPGRGDGEAEADFREAALLWTEERRSPTSAEKTASVADPVSHRAEGTPEGTDVGLRRALLRRSAALRRALTTEMGETSTESGSARTEENRRDGGTGKPPMGQLSRGETGGLELSGTGDRTAVEPDTSRAVSRQFEQDARRYDGGFFLY